MRRREPEGQGQQTSEARPARCGNRLRVATLNVCGNVGGEELLTLVADVARARIDVLLVQETRQSTEKMFRNIVLPDGTTYSCSWAADKLAGVGLICKAGIVSDTYPSGWHLEGCQLSDPQLMTCFLVDSSGFRLKVVGAYASASRHPESERRQFCEELLKRIPPKYNGRACPIRMLRTCVCMFGL